MRDIARNREAIPFDPVQCQGFRLSPFSFSLPLASRFRVWLPMPTLAVPALAFGTLQAIRAKDSFCAKAHKLMRAASAIRKRADERVQQTSLLGPAHVRRQLARVERLIALHIEQSAVGSQ